MRDEVYDILREWIMIGELQPGEKLRDQELSDLLGISRTPIREALLRLEDDGLVVTKANRWTIVAPIDLKQADNIFSIVKTLECLAVEQGFENFTKEDVNELEQLNEKFKNEMEQGDIISIFQADNAFHEKIVSSSENDELLNILKNLRVKIRRMEIYFFSNNIESYQEHLTIIQGVKRNNLSLVLKAISKNWNNSLNRIRSKIK